MKKLLLCALALLMLCGCAQTGSESAPRREQDLFDTLKEQVQARVEEEKLPEHVCCEDREEIAACYGFKAAALHDGYVLSSVYALNALEISLFYAKSEANVTAIAEKLRTYLDELEEQYVSAAPETAKLVREAEIICHENLCVLLLCEPSLAQSLSDIVRAQISAQ